jgi:hypothetical protein
VAWTQHGKNKPLSLVALLAGVSALAACGIVAPKQAAGTPSGTGANGGPTVRASPARNVALVGPAPLQPSSGTPAYAGEGVWHPAGRLVAGKAAVYETLLVPPGGSNRAGIAWMNAKLLSARLYSGSVSPGGGPYKYTAPVSPTAASTLVAAFNGGFKMADAHGGYYTEGRVISPLVRGGASLVIYADGSITVGAWGSDVSMTPSVVAVRQNLYPLVAGGRPTARATTRTWHVWGGTCPCGTGLHGTEYQWRSGLGVTADGYLVYVVGPQLDPLQVAELLVAAGAVRGMELDINPTWPVFASFKPATPGGQAAAPNGTRLAGTSRGPGTFFDPTYARDFITMSARLHPRFPPHAGTRTWLGQAVPPSGYSRAESLRCPPRRTPVSRCGHHRWRPASPGEMQPQAISRSRIGSVSETKWPSLLTISVPPRWSNIARPWSMSQPNSSSAEFRK